MRLLIVLFVLSFQTVFSQDILEDKQKFYNYVGDTYDVLINDWGIPDGTDINEIGIQIVWYEIGDQKGMYAFSIIDSLIGNSVFLIKQKDDIGTVFWYGIYQGLLLEDGFTLLSRKENPKRAHLKRNSLNITLELYKDDLNSFVIEGRAFIQ